MTKLTASPEDLRRLVAAEWWEWMPRMAVRILGGFGEARTLAGTDTRDRNTLWLFGLGKGWCGASVDKARVVPVVSNPATAGCLLDMYLQRDENKGRALDMLAHREPSAEAYASFGDFLAAVLLED